VGELRDVREGVRGQDSKMKPRPAIVIVVLALLAMVLLAPASVGVRERREPRRPVQVVKVVKERGFSWRDAGIGAAAAGLGISVVASSGLLLMRIRRPDKTL
jgi:hypothetical protein